MKVATYDGDTPQELRAGALFTTAIHSSRVIVAHASGDQVSENRLPSSSPIS